MTSLKKPAKKASQKLVRNKYGERARPAARKGNMENENMGIDNYY
jgi:hypothetical protein